MGEIVELEQAVQFDFHAAWLTDLERVESDGRISAWLFVKSVPGRKGELMEFTLDSWPGAAVSEGDRVEIVEPRVKVFRVDGQFKEEGWRWLAFTIRPALTLEV